MSIRWPKYVGDYALDEEISRRTIAEGLRDILLHLEIQLGLPFVYFKLRVAMNGVVFKLFSEGIKECNRSFEHSWVAKCYPSFLCWFLLLYDPGLFLF